jgi:predicted CDP-diglyceride synthetase/phosphatidate cytidylyltransferase
MDRFSLFFAFYGLILGLALTEILSGFAHLVRTRSLHRMEAQTALLALFGFLAITTIWIDAFSALREVQLTFRSLWPPILTATFYYAERKRFVITMFFACELLATYMVLPFIEVGYREAPAATWLYYLPFNLLIKGSYIGVFFARSRIANLVWLSILILLLGAQYWENGAIGDWVQQRFGALWAG